MKKVSINSKCPCGSGLKYKKCCHKFHKGVRASSALELMKSRYSAYVVGDAKYIIKTTHNNNSDFTTDIKTWSKSIIDFSNNSDFLSLKILEVENRDNEAFVKFKVIFSNSTMIEKSRFLKVNNIWLYESGIYEFEYATCSNTKSIETRNNIL